MKLSWLLTEAWDTVQQILEKFVILYVVSGSNFISELALVEEWNICCFLRQPYMAFSAETFFFQYVDVLSCCT